MNERDDELREQAWTLISNEERTQGELYETRERWKKCDQKFADLIRADEREACAKVCEDSVPTYLKDGERWLKGEKGKPDVRLKDIAPNLEAAWEAERLLKNGSVIESYSVQHQCAAAIRARGNT